MQRTFFSIFAIVGVAVLSQFVEISESYAACGPPTYAGCTGAQLRAIQSGQYYNRKIAPSIRSREVRRSDSYQSKADYWTDRQYQDRKDLEAANERREARELEARIRAEEAKRYSKQNINTGPQIYINGYGQKSYTNAPRPKPYVKPEPELKGFSHSKGKRVSSGN